MSAYQIEQGVKMPLTRAQLEAVYPFAKMAVGDSFMVPESEYQRVRSAASRYATRHNIKYTTRMIYEKNQALGVRVWRTE